MPFCYIGYENKHENLTNTKDQYNLIKVKLAELRWLGSYSGTCPYV